VGAAVTLALSPPALAAGATAFTPFPLHVEELLDDGTAALLDTAAAAGAFFFEAAAAAGGAQALLAEGAAPALGTERCCMRPFH
jgi:hypothetical protein